MFWLLTALIAPAHALDDVTQVRPQVTRAGFLRFGDSRFESLEGLRAVRTRLDGSQDPAERAALTDWLARLTLNHGGPAEVASLVQLGLTSVHDEVRLAVAERMVRSEHKAAFLPLATDRNADVRATALRMVDYASPAERVRLLQAGLNDPEAAVRISAIRSIQAYEPSMVASVQPRLTDADPKVRLLAADALNTLDPLAFEAARPLLQQDLDPRIRALAE